MPPTFAMSLFSGIFNIGIGAGALVGSQVSLHLSMASVGYVGAIPALVALVWSLMIFRRWPVSLEDHQRTTPDSVAQKAAGIAPAGFFSLRIAGGQGCQVEMISSTPLIINCTPMQTSRKPISREMASMPPLPTRRIIAPELRRQAHRITPNSKKMIGGAASTTHSGKSTPCLTLRRS